MSSCCADVEIEWLVCDTCELEIKKIAKEDQMCEGTIWGLQTR